VSFVRMVQINVHQKNNLFFSFIPDNVDFIIIKVGRNIGNYQFFNIKLISVLD